MRKTILIIGMLFTVIVSGCGGGASSSTVSYKVDRAVVVTGAVVDAATQAGIPADITVTVNGVTATVYDDKGKALAQPFTSANNGSVSFGLLQHPAADITFTITARNKSYNANSLPLTIKPSDAVCDFGKIALVSTSVSSSLSGIEKSVSLPTPAGVGISLSTPGTGSVTTAIIDAGVKVLAGATVLTGDLTMTAANYNPLKTTALALAPSDGSVFISTGFTDVTVRDSVGTVATTLSQPMKIRMDIATGTINPETGNPVAKDEVMRVYTFRAGSGSWEVDKDASNYNGIPGDVLVQQDAKGLFVEFTPNHFSYWNLGAKLGKKYCTQTLTLTGSAALSPLILTASGGTGTYYSGNKPLGDPTVTIANVPVNTTMIYTAKYGADTVGVSDGVYTGTTCPTVTLAVTLPESVSSYNFSTYRQCSFPYNGVIEKQFLPNVPIYACPGAALSLSFATCSYVGVTGPDGTVNGVKAVTGSKLFFWPSNNYPSLTPLSLTGSGEVDFIKNDWEFCHVTGSTGGSGGP